MKSKKVRHTLSEPREKKERRTAIVVAILIAQRYKSNDTGVRTGEMNQEGEEHDDDERDREKETRVSKAFLINNRGTSGSSALVPLALVTAHPSTV